MSVHKLHNTYREYLQTVIGIVIVATCLPHTTWASAGDTRVSHARELMGKYYANSVVNQTVGSKRIERYIHEETKDALPHTWKNQASRIAKVILEESKRHGFDPIFLMAVIENESSFRPNTRGLDGEIGLMQILPSTGKWIARLSKLKWRGEKTLLNPEDNIRIGAAYLAWLRDRFDSHARLYVAAYNMGQRNVDSARERNIWPREYPSRVMGFYLNYYDDLKSKMKARTYSSEQ